MTWDTFDKYLNFLYFLFLERSAIFQITGITISLLRGEIFSKLWSALKNHVECTQVGEYLSTCLAAFSMQEGARIRVLSRLFSPLSLLRTVEALLGNNVSVPYLFMCDRTRCQSAVGKRWNSPGEKKDAVIDFPAEQRGFFARQANRFRSSISMRGILFGGNSLSP